MGNLTSTLDIVLTDDVTKNAAQIEAALKKIAGEAKAVDGVLASSGASDKFGAALKRIGANVGHVQAATKALRDYAAAEGLSASRGDWTKAQTAGFKNMEGVVVSGTRAIIGAEKALADSRRASDAAAVASFEKSVGMWRQETAARERENERQLADDRRTAERRAEIHRQEIAREQRDRVREYEQEQRLHHRMAEQREHGIAHHGIVQFGLQSAAMAVSAHSLVHVGKEAWEQGAELQRERIGLQNAGRTPEEIREIEHAARGVQASTPTSGFIESLKTVAETTAAFGSVHHAIDNLPFISKMTSILKTAGGDNIHGDAAQLGQAFAKTFEERQTKPEEFEHEAKQMIPSMVATGGTFNPEQLYAFAQQAKSALPSLSMRFLSKIAPSLIGAQGGERAGTALKAFEDVIAGKVNDKKQAEEFLKLGLLDKNMAIMKAGHAVGWKSGAVKDTFLAMTDPLAWSEKYLIPALEKQGTDTSNREAVQMILNTMFRNQNANMFATEIAQEASRLRLHKDEELYGKVGSFDEIYARNLKMFSVAAEALKSALGNLAGAVTGPLMGLVAPKLVGLAGAINQFANLALQHPTIAGTGGVLAGAGALAGAGTLAYKLYNGFGLTGSAAALTGSAHAIDAAAGRLGVAGSGGLASKLPAGAIVPAGGGITGAVAVPAAVELAAAAVAGGIAVGGVALVKAAFEAQEPGNGGQWAPATLKSYADDQERLKDQQAEADRMRAEIDRNKRLEKIPGGSDANNLNLKQQLDEKLNQVENTRRSLAAVEAANSHEARVGRAMMERARPEEFGPNLPPELAGQMGYIDREAERARAYASMRRPEEFGPQRPAAGPEIPGDDALRNRYATDEIERSRAAAAASRPEAPREEFGPPAPPAPPPNVVPQVDTSPAEAGLMGLISFSSDAGSQMQSALNVTASPTVDTGSISAAIALAQQLAAALAAVGPAAAAAQAAVAGALSAAGGANAAVGARRSMQPAPAGPRLSI